jgi:hypothetical protein
MIVVDWRDVLMLACCGTLFVLGAFVEIAERVRKKRRDRNK